MFRKRNKNGWYGEAPNHLGYNLALFTGLNKQKCWIFEAALSDRYCRHPYFGDNPDYYYNRVISNFKSFKYNKDAKASKLLYGYYDNNKQFHHGLLGYDLMYFLLNGDFPVHSKYRKFLFI